MIIATSGTNKVHYSRIISLSVSPYSVQNSGTQTFVDVQSTTMRYIKGLFIKDINNILSLNHQSGWIVNVEIASINFSTS